MSENQKVPIKKIGKKYYTSLDNYFKGFALRGDCVKYAKNFLKTSDKSGGNE